jgi:hypothetical protein
MADPCLSRQAVDDPLRSFDPAQRYRRLPRYNGRPPVSGDRGGLFQRGRLEIRLAFVREAAPLIVRLRMKRDVYEGSPRRTPLLVYVFVGASICRNHGKRNFFDARTFWRNCGVLAD